MVKIERRIKLDDVYFNICFVFVKQKCLYSSFIYYPFNSPPDTPFGYRQVSLEIVFFRQYFEIEFIELPGNSELPGNWKDNENEIV